MANIAAGFSFLFLLGFGFAFVVEQFWLALACWCASVLCKVWFVDRMAWLWDDMKNAHAVYQAWNRAQWDRKFDV